MKTIFRARVFPAIAGIAMAGSFFAFAGGASAAALTSSQISSILALLQSFGVDSATIANVQGVLTGTGSATSTAVFQTPPTIMYPTTASSSCATLPGTIRPGSRGPEVEQLQAFLAKNPNIYPQGVVSGYYGKLTEDAVSRWQAAQGIVSTGTPQTTGFGAVGPETRGALDHEMEVECESGDHPGAQGGEGGDHASATSTWARSGDHGATGEQSSATTTQDN